MKSYFVTVVFLLLVLTSCKEQDVIITKDYVINPNWDEESNSFEVVRMKLKYGEKINLINDHPSDIRKKLIEDTSFSFIANVRYNGQSYYNRKVYFNKDNGFVWLTPFKISQTRLKFRTIGELQRETWYFLGGLSNVRALHYVYIDSLDSIHIVKVPASAWTNI